jgi:hypothetical protein
VTYGSWVGRRAPLIAERDLVQMLAIKDNKHRGLLQQDSLTRTVHGKEWMSIATPRFLTAENC